MQSDHSAPGTQVCIAGGGPAGMMLGYLLARSGVPVTVLERHGDFLRDFRGDTVHPSTLEVLQQCGLKSRFDELPQRRIRQGRARIGDDTLDVVDFHGLSPFDYVALVPQWDFLDLLASEASKLDHFTLRMNHEVTDLIIEQGRVRGVRVKSPEGDLSIQCRLVVGCDGRDSTVRTCLDLSVMDLGAPMDALWFRLPREPSDGEGLQAVLGAGNMMVMIDRQDYWQVAFIVSKGSDSTQRERPIADFRSRVAELAPELGDRCSAIGSWDDVKTLVVKVDRLKRWHAPGVLLIGDAAHAMSPIGGVGINLAIQDAVCAANCLAKSYREDGSFDEAVLRAVQQAREWPTRIIQRFQLLAQRRLVSRVLERSGETPQVPRLLRWLTRFRLFRNIPARVIGYGFGRQQVQTRWFDTAD